MSLPPLTPDTWKRCQTELLLLYAREFGPVNERHRKEHLVDAPCYSPPISTRLSREAPAETGSKTNATPPEIIATRHRRVQSHSPLLSVVPTATGRTRRTFRNRGTANACLSQQPHSLIPTTASAWITIVARTSACLGELDRSVSSRLEIGTKLPISLLPPPVCQHPCQERAIKDTRRNPPVPIRPRNNSMETEFEDFRRRQRTEFAQLQSCSYQNKMDQRIILKGARTKQRRAGACTVKRQAEAQKRPLCLL